MATKGHRLSTGAPVLRAGWCHILSFVFGSLDGLLAEKLEGRNRAEARALNLPVLEQRLLDIAVYILSPGFYVHRNRNPVRRVNWNWRKDWLEFHLIDSMSTVAS